MDFIKAITFTGLNYFQIGEDRAKESLRTMKEKTACNTLILILGALQDTAYTDQIDYKHEFMPTDKEILDFISYAKKMGLRIILKPVVNCKDGTWRAHIHFFENGSGPSGESNWDAWFDNYGKYQLHYAKLAQKCGCEMIIAGCELVMSESHTNHWRKIFEQIRSVYDGLICYNADKYHENEIGFWDSVDIIGSSGYYPIEGFEEQLGRLEALAEYYQKPFFFAEMGCRSCEGASKQPGNWMLQGKVSLEEQAQYFSKFFHACRNHSFIIGYGVWDWHNRLYREERGRRNNGYSLYGKPVCEIIRKEFSMTFSQQCQSAV